MNDTWWVSQNSLDPDQQSVISLDPTGSFLIQGPPGSGKTNLLLLRAKYLTLAGQPNIKVILFTRALREFIASGATQYGFTSKDVITSQAFWMELLHQYGVSLPSMPDFDAQRRALVALVMQLVTEHQIQDIYQTILLDEAHDFLPEEIELFARLSRSLFAVADRRQKIYSGEAPFSVLEKVTDRRVTLHHHYRNGHSICHFADLLGRDRSSFEVITPASNYDEQARPSAVQTHRCDSLDDEIDRVLQTLDDQLNAYPDELIGIISPSKAATTRVWQRICGSKYLDIATRQGEGDNLSFDADIRICVSTLHTAKGLEYRALHVVSCENFKKRPLPRSLAFTAVTRAKTSLDLYYSSELMGFLEEAVAALTPPSELPNLDDIFSTE